MFERLKRREEYTGTGIGATISKRVVDQHRGRIWVWDKQRFKVQVHNS